MPKQIKYPGTVPARKRKQNVELIVGVKSTTFNKQSQCLQKHQKDKLPSSNESHIKDNSNKEIFLKPKLEPNGKNIKTLSKNVKRRGPHRRKSKCVKLTDKQIYNLLDKLPPIPLSDEEIIACLKKLPPIPTLCPETKCFIEIDVPCTDGDISTNTRIDHVEKVEIKTFEHRKFDNYVEIDPSIISVGLKPTLIVESPGTITKFLARLGLYELARIDIARDENFHTVEESDLINMRKTIDENNVIEVDNKLYNYIKLYRHSSYENRAIKLEHYRNIAKKYVSTTSNSITMTTQQTNVMTHTIARAVDDFVDDLLSQQTLSRKRNSVMKVIRNFFSPRHRQLNKEIAKSLKSHQGVVMI